MTREVARQVREREQLIAERAREAATQAMGERAHGLDIARLAGVTGLMGDDAFAEFAARLEPREIDWLLAYSEAYLDEMRAVVQTGLYNGDLEAKLARIHGKVDAKG
jgi:hypothetical protein